MPHLDDDDLRTLLGPLAEHCRRALSGQSGISLPPFVDHHVHLHLADEHGLARHGIAGVVDLGGDPAVLAQRRSGRIPRVAYAGAFLTAPGGYPVGRSWAPAGTVYEVRSASRRPGRPGGAGTAVDEQAAFGASVIKVVLHEEGLPALDDPTLAIIVDTAHRRGLPVVAHAQGPGTVYRALEHGIDALAHVPFSQRLSAVDVSQAARTQAWISTLAIHDADSRAIAIANLRDFAAWGGRVLYGTDLGNGVQPVGVNAEELVAMQAAGVSGAELIAALTDPWPAPLPEDFDDDGDSLAHVDDAVATFVPGDPPPDVDDLPHWLADARVVPAEELIYE